MTAAVVRKFTRWNECRQEINTSGKAPAWSEENVKNREGNSDGKSPSLQRTHKTPFAHKLCLHTHTRIYHEVQDETLGQEKKKARPPGRRLQTSMLIMWGSWEWVSSPGGSSAVRAEIWTGFRRGRHCRHLCWSSNTLFLCWRRLELGSTSVSAAA